jgi:hypothetical protein
MASTVETFRGISVLIFKWLLFAVLGIVGIALAIGGVAYAYNYLTRTLHSKSGLPAIHWHRQSVHKDG